MIQTRFGTLLKRKPRARQSVRVVAHGRKPLYFTHTHLNINPSDLARIDAIVGRKALSKFVRDAIRQQLDRIAPGEEQAGPPLIGVEG